MTKSLSVFTSPEQNSDPKSHFSNHSPHKPITNLHPSGASAPTRGLPSRYPVFFVFSFVYAGFRGVRAPGRGIWQGARVQKKPYAVGFPQHKASLVCYVVLGLRETHGNAQLSCHFWDQ